MSEGQRNRFVLFPIEYPEIWEKYKQAVRCFWTTEECDFSQDVKDLETLTDNERFFIENVLAFFAGADGIVNENLAQRFMSDVDIPEARCFTGETLINLSNGTSKYIKDVNIGDTVLGWSATEKKVVPKKVTFLRPRDELERDIVKLTLEDGRTISCTPDHKFLTQDGQYVEARNLKAGELKVCATVYHPNMHTFLRENSWSLDLGEFGILNTSQSFDKLLALSRIVGMILTDGSIALNTKGLVTMRIWIGTDIGKNLILDDICLLCGKRPNTGQNVRSVNIPESFGRAIYDTDTNTFTAGKRVSRPYYIPRWILDPQCPLPVVLEYLAGLFGGDGHTSNLNGSLKRLKFQKIAFSATKTPEHIDSLITGFQFIQSVLLKVGIESIISDPKEKTPGKFEVRLAFKTHDHTVLFEKFIGFRYDVHKAYRLAVAATYYRKRFNSVDFRDEIIQNTKELKTDNLTWASARTMAIEATKKRRVQIGDDAQSIPSIRVIKGNPKTARCNMGNLQHIENWVNSIGALSFMRSDDTEKSYAVKPDDPGIPIFFLDVVTVKPAGQSVVYDISVEDPINSFVANGIIAHNCFYGWQIAMENVHAETYSLMIDTFVKSQERKNELFSAVVSDGAVGRKAQWALKWISGDQPFVQRLFAFACVEGIFFSGSFCAIFWLKKRNLMPGLCYSNELISRDEGLHCEFACLLVRILGLDTSELLPILVEAVAIEHEYVRESIRVNLIGMNADSMCSYIEFVADRLLVAIGLPKHYNTPNPFEWMELISLQNKTNFFEKRVSEYSRALGRSMDSGGSGSEKLFTLEEDF